MDSGITTNPIILAREGMIDELANLLVLDPAALFYRDDVSFLVLLLLAIMTVMLLEGWMDTTLSTVL